MRKILLSSILAFFFTGVTFAQLTAPVTETFDAFDDCSNYCGSGCALSGLGWQNSASSSIDWIVNSGGTPSFFTGPSDDAGGGGKYLYQEASGDCNPYKQAIVTTPTIDISGLTCGLVSFEYHMHDGRTLDNMGDLYLEVEDLDDPGNWIEVEEIRGRQGNVWNLFEGAIPSSVDGVVRFRFRGITGTGYQSDIAIDNFIVKEDDVDPVAICQDITVYVDEGGTATITDASDLDGGSYDNCSETLTYSASKTVFDCDDIASNPNAVTLTVEDAVGNTSSCSANVTVEDNVDPTAVCQQATVTLSIAGTQTVDPNAVDGGSTDNCSVAELSVDPSTVTCDDVPSTTVVLTVTDGSGNTATCEATVNVVDNTDPILSCETSATVTLDENGEYVFEEGVEEDLIINLIELCDYTVTYTPATVTCSHVLGGASVDILVEDASGNTSSCTGIDVTVEDNMAPEAMCQDVTVCLDDAGSASVSTSDVDDGSTDNCFVTGYALDINMFDCSDLDAPVTVELTVTDNSANESTCTSEITVLDKIAPTATCTATATVCLDSNGEAAIASSTIFDSATDNCASNLAYTVSPTLVTCEDIGSVTVILYVSDGYNTGSCTTDISVLDKEAPQATCSAVIDLSLDENGEAVLSEPLILQSSSDNCGIEQASTTIDPMTTFTCAEAGTTVSATITVYDESGNAASCSTDVTISDDLAPVVQCTQTIELCLDDAGMATLTAAEVATAEDNCNVASSTIDKTNFDCSDVGVEITVTYTAEDDYGNAASCIASVDVLDKIAPTATCTASITVSLDSNGDATIDASSLDDGSTDNCTSPLSFTSDPSAVDCSDIGTVTVTLIATDDSGNSGTCTSDVIVEDNEAPVAVCMNHTEYLDSAGMGTLTVDEIEDGSTDNCGIATSTLDITSIGCAELASGTITVVLTEEDASGNQGTCTSTVTVTETIAPTPVCSLSVTKAVDASGSATVFVDDIDAGSHDDPCNSVVDLYFGTSGTTERALTCDDDGLVITMTVEDPQGNTATCDATITVEDNIDPTPVCMDISHNVEETLEGSDIDGGSTDNCNVASLSADPSTFDCSDLGAQTVTLTVTDDAGNTATCDATVTVEDQTDPDPVCMDITVAVEDDGDVIVPAADIDGGSSDNCDGSLDLLINGSASETFDCSDVASSPITVVLTVTDDAGNSATCEADITLTSPVVFDMVEVVNASWIFGKNGSVTVTVSGGTGPYDFDWSGTNIFGGTVSKTTIDDADGTDALTELRPGAYGVTVTDANGCSVSGTAFVGWGRQAVSERDAHVDQSIMLSPSEDVTITESDEQPLVGDVSADAINLYPNPSSGLINIDLSLVDAEQVTIDIYDIIGGSKLMNLSRVVEGISSTQLDLGHLAAGQYMVRFAYGDQIVNRKIVLTR